MGPSRSRLVALAISLAFPSCLMAQWGAVTMQSPSNNSHTTSSSVSAQFKGCSNVTQQSWSPSGFSQSSLSSNQCPDYTSAKSYSGTVSLSAGANTITGQICNSQASPTCQSSSITVYMDVPNVSVTPDGGSASAITDGNQGSYQFTVTNNGDLNATADFSPSCSGNLTSCYASPTSASINAGSNTTVTVYYTGAGAGSGTATLTATYQSPYSSTTDNGSVSVTVNPKPVATVTVTRTGAATIGVGQTSGFTARTYASDASELTGRSISWSGSYVSVSPGSGTSAASTTATGSSAGSGSVTATSEGVSGSESITVVNPTYAVSVTTNIGNPVNAPAGATATGTLRYFVTNNSTYTSSASTFALASSRSGIVSSCPTPSSTSVTLAPGEMSDPITMSCAIGATTAPTSGSATLTASTSSPASFSNSYTHTVNATPNYAVSVVADVSSKTEAARATTGYTTFRVYNNSVNAGGSASIALSRSCTVVVWCPANGGSVTVSEGSYSTVTVNYDVAWTNTSGGVALTASLGGASGNASTSIGTTPYYAVTVTRTNASQTLGAGATSGSTTFTVFNNSSNTGVNTTYSLAASCSGPFVTGCSASPTSVVLADQASSTTNGMTANYNTALSGQTGSVTLTASASSPGSQSHNATTTVNATAAYSVAIQVIGPTQALAAQTTSDVASFKVLNTSTNTNGSAVSFDLTASCSGVVSCSSGQGSVSLTENSISTVRTVPVTVSLVGTTGSVTFTATATSPSFTGNNAASIATTPYYAVTVTPNGSGQTLAAQSTSGSSNYTVSNVSTNTPSSVTFNLTAPTCSGVASECSPSASQVTLAQGANSAVNVTYAVSLSGTSGSVALKAATTSPATFEHTGTQSLTATAYYAVTVSSGSQTLAAQVTSGTSTYSVQNVSTNTTGSIGFTLNVPTCSGVASSCSPSSSQLTLAQGASQGIDVDYSVSSSGTSGSVALRAATGSPSTFEGSGTKSLTTTPSYSVLVTPATGSPSVGAGTSGNYGINIQNTSWNTALPITVSLSTPGCGNTVLSCSVGSNSNNVSQGSQSPTVSLAWNAVGLGNETVALNASGSVSGGASVGVTNGSAAFSVSDTGTIAVAVSGLNKGTTIDRGDCLTIASGQNAAYECGDLRVVHGLPATITMGKARAPTLIYNSRHAKPGALLAANVTYSGTTPATLEATVTIPNWTPIVKTFTWNSTCSGTTCRIVVPIDAATTVATNLYEATIQVRAKSSSFTYATSSAVTDTVVIVNRSTSPYGAGWWVDGLESFVSVSSTKKLWVGGDGSTRLYSRTSDTSVFVVSPTYDRPDTLKQISSTVWRRLLGNGAYVEFDGYGKHKKTVNALGWETRFAYAEAVTNTPLDTITLPVPSGGPTLRYFLWYSLNGSNEPALDSVNAPQASLGRKVSTSRTNHFQITGLTDPDGYASTFGYDGSSRITWRRNKLNDTTFFQYDDAGALKEAKLSTARTDTAGANITTSFRAAESRSAYSSSDVPTLLSKAYSQVDGPRPTAVGDTTNFFVNRWGAPDTVVNALGQKTRVRRENSSFPALATASVAPSGFESRAYFNSRALLDSTVAMDPYDVGCNGTSDRSCYSITRLVWNSVWNRADSSIGPTGERSRTFYKTSLPLPDSIRAGSNTARTTKFTYSSVGQVTSVTEPAGQPDSMFYDAAGNLSKTRSPLGFIVEQFRDALGRDTLVKTPTDTAQADSLKKRVRTKYNAADQVDSLVTYGAKMNYALIHATKDTASLAPDTIYANNAYDAEGRRTLAKVLSSYSPNAEAPVVTIQQWTFDAAGRSRLLDRDGLTDTTFYDAAGNVIQSKTYGGGGFTQSFDALNRVTQRIVAEKTYSRKRCENMQAGPLTNPSNINYCLTIFPAYPNAANGALLIAVDTAFFTYGASGNMLTADNGDAKVHRQYYSSGAIKRDSALVRAPNNGTFGHSSVILPHYDLSGRRDSVTMPSGSKVAYTFNTSDDGALTSITDPYSTQYRYVYSLAGRVDSMVIGSGTVREKRWYDADGRQYARERYRSGSDSNLTKETLTFDARGLVTKAATYSRVTQQSTDTTYLAYNGLGAVIAREHATLSGAWHYETEEFRTDALGNVLRTRALNWDQTERMPMASGYGNGHRGRLGSRVNLNNTEWPYEFDDLTLTYDNDGQQIASHHHSRDKNNNYLEDTPTRSYYGNDGKLRAMQRHIWTGGGDKGSWEEYRYDAVGRRVAVISRFAARPPACDTLGLSVCAGLCTVGDCASKVLYTVWDGAAVLREDREPYPGGSTNTAYHAGIEYVHGPELDHPLAALDTRVSGNVRILNPNWRGLFESSVTASAGAADCSIGSGSCQNVTWPAGQPIYQRALPFDFGGGTTITWAGSLLLDGQDGTGQMYRRNRYYDPDAGRFTQEDPIGLAGGMNLYGFAGGDPVNFSDPMGLCPIEVDGIPCTLVGGVLGGLAGGLIGGVAGASGGTLALPVGGTIVGGGGGAIGGSFIGFVAGSAAGAYADVTGTALALDWSGVKKSFERVVHGAAVVGGLLAGGEAAADLSKVWVRIQKARAEAEATKKKQDEERKKKEKEQSTGPGGSGDPPQT